VVFHTGLVTPLEHAWMERPDGVVIDPTMNEEAAEFVRGRGQPEEDGD
jgi:hypothetical protein